MRDQRTLTNGAVRRLLCTFALRDPANLVCFDCQHKQKSVEWLSLALGVFVCVRIHPF